MKYKIYLCFLFFTFSLCDAYIDISRRDNEADKCPSNLMSSIAGGPLGDHEKPLNETEIRTVIECMDICGNISTCEYNRDIPLPRCYCDSRCFLYGDCCMDAYGNGSTSEISQETEILIQRSECITDIEENTRGTSPYLVPGVMMVDSCLLGNENKSEYRVEDMWMSDFESFGSPSLFYIANRIPVYDSETDLTYTNVYTAHCNKANASSLIFWKMYIILEWCDLENNTITENEAISLYEKLFFYIAEKMCPYYILPPSHESVRHCIKKPDKNISSILLELCNLHSNPVLGKSNSVYDNIFCKMLIDQKTPNINQKYVECADDHHDYVTESCFLEQEDEFTEDGNLAYLVDLKITVPLKAVEEEEKPCPDGMIWHEGSCGLFEKYRNYPITQFVQLMVFDTASRDLIHSAISAFQHILSHNYLPYIQFVDNTINTTHGVWDYERESCVLIEFELNLRTRGWMNRMDIEKLKVWIKSFDFRYDEDNFISKQYLSFVRKTRKTSMKFPDCYIDPTSKETMTPPSQAEVKELFQYSYMDAKLEYLKVFCDGIIFKTQQMLERVDVTILDIRQIVELNCTDDVLPELNVRNSILEDNTLLYISITFSSSTIFISLFYNISKLEFSSLIGRSSVHMLGCHALVLACYLMCPSSKHFEISGAVLHFLIHYLWLCTFTWCTLMSFLVFRLTHGKTKKSKDGYYGSVFENRMFIGSGYTFPLFGLIPFIYYRYFSDNPAPLFQCMSTDTSLILLGFGTPSVLFLTLSGILVVTSLVNMREFPTEEPWLSLRAFGIMLLFFACGLGATSMIGFVALFFQNITIWKMFLGAEAINAASICVGYVIGRRHSRILKPKKEGDIKW